MGSAAGGRERLASAPWHFTFGPTDLLVGAVCRDNQHLLEVTKEIREVPGVAETDTAVILSELKDSYRFSETVRPD